MAALTMTNAPAQSGAIDGFAVARQRLETFDTIELAFHVRRLGDPPPRTLPGDVSAILRADRTRWTVDIQGAAASRLHWDGVALFVVNRQAPRLGNTEVQDLWGEITTGFARSTWIADHPEKHGYEGVARVARADDVWARLVLPFDWATDLTIFVSSNPRNGLWWNVLLVLPSGEAFLLDVDDNRFDEPLPPDALQPYTAHSWKVPDVWNARYGLAGRVHSDHDGDGIRDMWDNCILVSSQALGDRDLDGLGDPCDDTFDVATAASGLTVTTAALRLAIGEVADAPGVDGLEAKVDAVDVELAGAVEATGQPTYEAHLSAATGLAGALEQQARGLSNGRHPALDADRSARVVSLAQRLQSDIDTMRAFGAP